MKILLPVILIISIIFNFNMPAMAAAVSPETITISQTPQTFLASDKSNDNAIIDMFSPDDHNIDLMVAVILSVVPGFGVGHFWLGDEASGWTFFKLDLVMLALPFAIALVQTIFSSLNLIVKPTDSMNNTNVFNILGIIAWAGALGIKIWETASVWRFIEQVRKEEKSGHKMTFYLDKVEVSLVNF